MMMKVIFNNIVPSVLVPASLAERVQRCFTDLGALCLFCFFCLFVFRQVSVSSPSPKGTSRSSARSGVIIHLYFT